MSIYDQIANFPLNFNPVGSYMQGQQVARQNRLSDLQYEGQKIDNQLNQKKMLTGGIDIGQINPRDFTAPSISKFQQTNDWNDLQRFIPPKSATKVDVGNAWEFYDPVTNKLLRSVPIQLGPNETIDYLTESAAAKEGAVQEQKHKWAAKIAKDVALAKAQAQGQGEAAQALASQTAAYPGIKDTITRMKTLADSATYTLFGQGFDWAAKQFGFDATPGATDRAKFISLLDNQVLPMLKPIFGAAFTAVEGDRLRATLGDPDASPQQKQAALDTFLLQVEKNIEAKKLEIKTLSSQPQQGQTVQPDKQKRPNNIPQPVWDEMTDDQRALF